MKKNLIRMVVECNDEGIHYNRHVTPISKETECFVYISQWVLSFGNKYIFKKSLDFNRILDSSTIYKLKFHYTFIEDESIDEEGIKALLFLKVSSECRKREELLKKWKTVRNIGMGEL